MEDFSVAGLLAEDDWLRRLARRLVRDPEEADDLVQETWVRALARPPAAGRDARGYLRTILGNLRIDASRRRAARTEREWSVGRERAVPDEVDLVQEAAVRSEVARGALELDEPERTAVLLRFYKGLAYKEIALRQGVTVSAAHQRVERGLETLRRRLDARTPGGRRAWVVVLGPLVAPSPGSSRPSAARAWPAALLLVGLGVVGTVGWRLAAGGGGEPAAPPLVSAFTGEPSSPPLADEPAREPVPEPPRRRPEPVPAAPAAVAVAPPSEDPVAVPPGEESASAAAAPAAIVEHFPDQRLEGRWLRIAADGARVVVARPGGAVEVWRTDGRRPTADGTLPPVFQQVPSTLAIAGERCVAGRLGTVVFERGSDAAWLPAANLDGSLTSITVTGRRVALAPDGASAAVAGEGLFRAGSGGDWIRTDALQVGPSCSLAYDGSTLALGDPLAATVALYDVVEGRAEHVATLTDPESGEGFGASVALDGDRLLVGAPGAYRPSAACFFERRDGEWVAVDRVVDPDWPEELGGIAERATATTFTRVFGADVALRGDQALVGAPSPMLGVEDLESMFTQAGINAVPVADTLPAEQAAVFPDPTLTYGDVAQPGAAVAEIPDAPDGVVYTLLRKGDRVRIRDTIEAPRGFAASGFGRSVAISGELAIVASSGPYQADLARLVTELAFRATGVDVSTIAWGAAPEEPYDRGSAGVVYCTLREGKAGKPRVLEP